MTQHPAPTPTGTTDHETALEAAHWAYETALERWGSQMSDHHPGWRLIRLNLARWRRLRAHTAPRTTASRLRYDAWRVERELGAIISAGLGEVSP